ncbi:hypothetical protein [Palaeococcus pacificus]|nr:hypothetical protein [Palaeococcus pacificus]
MRILGIARLYSTLTIYVQSEEDVEILGDAPEKPLGGESIGEIAVGMCQVLKSSTYLKLNCTKLKLYNAKARTGDIIKFRALRRKNSLYCLNCIVVKKREALENSICQPQKEGIIKIEGNVSWIKIYKNGFGLANITNNNCWILLKLKKSLNLTLSQNQSIVAFGEFTTYRDMPALKIDEREDVCLKSSS